jgi:hypothetical protein
VDIEFSEVRFVTIFIDPDSDGVDVLVLLLGLLKIRYLFLLLSINWLLGLEELSSIQSIILLFGRLLRCLIT